MCHFKPKCPPLLAYAPNSMLSSDRRKHGFRTFDNKNAIEIYIRGFIENLSIQSIIEKRVYMKEHFYKVLQFKQLSYKNAMKHENITYIVGCRSAEGSTKDLRVQYWVFYLILRG